MLAQKKHILDISRSNLTEIKIPNFRLKQIENWFYKNFTFSPDEMFNIPLNLREQLKDNYCFEFPKIEKQKKTSDKTEKFLLKLKDGEFIEFVIISAPNRKTFCLSSQIGCPIQCKFCASGALGLKRNLSSSEILAQFMIGSRIIGKLPDNVVFMGIGEPLLNFENLKCALDKINSKSHFNYAPRRITISTSGIPKKIKQLADLGKQWNLAVSIHAPDDKTRALLIPEKASFPLNDIVEACKYYFDKTGRLITFEYTLIKSINDKNDHAEKLSLIAKKVRAKINLIPYNPVPFCNFSEPGEKSIISFRKILEKNGVNCMFRVEKGRKINAACGQLRIERVK